MFYECIPYLSDKFRKETIIYAPECVKQFDYSESMDSFVLPDDNGEYYQKLVTKYNIYYLPIDSLYIY